MAGLDVHKLRERRYCKHDTAAMLKNNCREMYPASFLQRSPQFLCFFDWPKQNLSIGRSKTFQLADTKGYNQPHD